MSQKESPQYLAAPAMDGLFAVEQVGYFEKSATESEPASYWYESSLWNCLICHGSAASARFKITCRRSGKKFAQISSQGGA